MWKELSDQFPRIALMARDIFCVPGASVSVERTFSVARHQYRYNRTYSRNTFAAIMVGRSKLGQEEQEALQALARAEDVVLASEDVLFVQTEAEQRHSEVQAMMDLAFISDVDEETPSGSSNKRVGKRRDKRQPGRPPKRRRAVSASSSHLSL